MESTAKLRTLRMSPRKVRYVAALVRGQPVGRALQTLQFTERAAAKPLAKLIRSAIANAEQKGLTDVDTLVVRSLTVDGGPMLKRFMPRAQGRASPIHKPTSHITVVLGDR